MRRIADNSNATGRPTCEFSSFVWVIPAIGRGKADRWFELRKRGHPNVLTERHCSRLEIVDRSPPAPPSLDHPLLSRLREQGAPVRAKLGWTDVARFAERGIPAVNFGPGDATVAHTAEEHVHRDSIERVHRALHSLLLS